MNYFEQVLTIYLSSIFLKEVLSIQTPDPRIIYEESEKIEKSVQTELNCLKKIILETFEDTGKSMVTIPISEMNPESNDVQDEIIVYLNKKANWTIQILSELPHIEFKSSQACHLQLSDTIKPIEVCRRHFVLREDTDYYIIIIDQFYQLEEKIYSVYNSTSFNPSAEFLIYHRRSDDSIVQEMIPILDKYSIFKVVVIDFEIKKDSAKVFVLEMDVLGPGSCLDGNLFHPAGLCHTESQSETLKNILGAGFPKIFNDCTIPGIAMRYEPYVINEDEGIETKLLKEMAIHINARFILNVTGRSEDWGDKVNGTWNGNFAHIFGSLMIGIGNVGPEADRIEDFEFTYSHYSATLVWVVPIAAYIRKWRVLTIIFSLEVWAIIFAVLILAAILFVTFSRYCKDNTYLQEISGSFLASFQILIASSVHSTPKTEMVRIVFSAALIFALIINCVYTSSLMNVLKNVVREHQIDSVEEIVESNLEIGGLEEYKERFEDPSDGDGCLDELCERYRFFEGECNTAQVWLDRVERRISCTPLPMLFVKYYMTQTYKQQDHTNGTGNPMYDESQRVKLFILGKPINFYPLSIVLKKGNPFKDNFDTFMKKFLEAGLFNTLTRKYKTEFQKLEYLISNSDNGPEKLTVYHLQGPFAVLGVGGIISVFIFIMELIWRRRSVDKSRKKNEDESFRIMRLDPTNKRSYYDKTYGNMYRRTFPSNLHKRKFVISKK